MVTLIDKLYEEKILTREEFFKLLSSITPSLSEYLFKKAREVALSQFGNRIYIRGLIEISNYCKNNCYYCGIRSGNKKASRYRLTPEDILVCCQEGYELGFRTFVLQGGEDPGFHEDKMMDLIGEIKSRWPDCSLTLSLGEKPREIYQNYFDSGADRYLLRHETADEDHYRRLHPLSLTLKSRKRCLWDLKEIGFQVGTGFMVGSPFQTIDTIIEDLFFINQLSPEMIGIGPFLPHHDTPFCHRDPGSLDLTLFLVAILRLMIPGVLLPATTAVGTITEDGRERGILAGANVVMPNLSPLTVRKKYMLYDNKISTDEESAQGIQLLKKRLSKIGYEIVVDRGDYRY
ncbi:MAG: [FeFe] hydrogenase H-cluster radical SAM maturase HydE [Anaerovoracaceae bacterium]|jgi:biotin synthase